MPTETSTCDTRPIRYQQVRQILDSAAGRSSADYRGLGRFWNLPLAEFLTVVVCDVRMIAPGAEATPSAAPGVSGSPPAGTPCCHAAPQPPPAPPVVSTGKRNVGRGARSGLIIGLKGAWPFDGTQFPRLPWGGTQVMDSDIDFISRWIDDGCPEFDGDESATAEGTKLLATGDTPHAVSVLDPNVVLGEAGNSSFARMSNTLPILK